MEEMLLLLEMPTKAGRDGDQNTLTSSLLLPCCHPHGASDWPYKLRTQEPQGSLRNVISYKLDKEGQRRDLRSNMKVPGISNNSAQQAG